VNAYAAGLLGEYNEFSNTEKDIAATLKVPNNRKFIRPEEFSLSKAPLYRAEGKILERKYYGSHYALDMMVAGKRILVHHHDGRYQEGDVVFIAFDQQ